MEVLILSFPAEISNVKYGNRKNTRNNVRCLIHTGIPPFRELIPLLYPYGFNFERS